MNTPIDLRLGPAAAGTWAICIVAVRMPAHGTRIALGVTAALAILALAAPRRRSRHRVPWRGWFTLTLVLGCLVTLLAGVIAGGQVAARQTHIRLAHTHAAPDTELHLRLTSEVTTANTPGGAHGKLLRLDTGQGPLDSDIPVYIIGAGEHWRVGQHVTLTGRLTPADEQRMFLRVGEVRGEDPPQGVYRVVDRLRRGVRDASRAQPPHARGLIPGVSIGDDRRLPTSLADAMRTTSLTHITAVSGAHVAIVLSTVMALLAPVPAWAKAALASVVLAAMVLVVLPTPSVVRAAGMGGLTLLALARRRPRLALPALLFTVIVLLSYDPWLSTSIGFALSVAATFGIIITAAPIAQVFGGSVFARAIAVPLAAQMWCAPLLLTFDPVLATYAVPANLLAMPALAPATISGLASALLSQVSPAAAALASSVGGYFTGWIAVVAHFFANLPGARLPWLEGALGRFTLVALTLCVLWFFRQAYLRRTWQA